MLEEAVPSIWASMNSWFTQTVLFILLNLVIGTIAVTSKRHHSSAAKLAATEHDDPFGNNHHHRPALVRGPSSVLERLRSIGLYRYRSGEIPLETTTAPAAVASSTVHVARSHESEAAAAFETLDDAYEAAASSSSQEHNFNRSQSDSHPTAGEMPARLPEKLKKSASAKSAFAHFKAADLLEQEVPRRPSTVRETAPARHAAEDEEVDAKADDFINRFRQQLKLQRLDSILRYKEMLGRSK